MIGKGSFFDIITKTTKDINNPDNDIDMILENYRKREEIFKEKIKN